MHFKNQITLKSSLAKKLKLIFKFSTITVQISVPLWTHMGQRMKKGWKTFMRCYAIALKIWDEFNADFVLLYFSTFSSIKMWHLYLKNIEKKNKAVHSGFGKVPPSPTSFSPVTSTNVGIRRQNFLTCSFNPFDRLVYWQIIEQESRPPLTRFFWSNLDKLEVMITSLIQMLELPNLVTSII